MDQVRSVDTMFSDFKIDFARYSYRGVLFESHTSRVGNSSFIIFSFTFFYNKRRFLLKPKFFFYFLLLFLKFYYYEINI